jgi:hypothetical protein
MTAQRMTSRAAPPTERGGAAMRFALTHHLNLGSVRDLDWVAAHFGHR